MARYQDDDDDFDYEDGADLPKKLRAQIKQLSKERDEANAKVAQYESVERKRSIATVLEARGINPAVAKFVPQDIEASEDAVAAWLTENGDVFAPAAPQAPQGEPQAPPPEADPFRRMAAVEHNAQPPISMDDLAQVQAMTGEELDRMLRVNGGH